MNTNWNLGSNSVYKSLNKVLKSDLCSGCGVCTAIDNNIEMRINDDGYSRPHLIDRKISEPKEKSSLFEKICPGLTLDSNLLVKDSYDEIWGNLRDIRTGYSTDSELRNIGSSGGVISALSKFLVESGEVDAVINVSGGKGISNEIDFRNKNYDFRKSAGSRYSPASPCSLISQLDFGKKYLFVGKPCDVAAIRQLKNENKAYDSAIKYLISFMCAGTPSYKGTHKVLDKFGIKEDDLIEFRYRGDGWPGLTKAVSKDGKVASMTYNESWGKILNKELQTRCKICVDGIGEFADVVCADYWECDEKGYPIFDEMEGRSLIIARTEIGCELIKSAEKENQIDLHNASINNLNEIQPFQYYRRVSILSRLLAMKMLMLNTPKYKNFNLVKVAFKAGFKLNVKSFMGLVLRRKKIKKINLC